jgi:hypothetical protein
VPFDAALMMVGLTAQAHANGFASGLSRGVGRSHQE